MCRNQLGIALRGQGKYPEAEQEFRAVLAIQERLHGPEDPQVLQDLFYLAQNFAVQKKFREALELVLRVERGSDKLFGPTDNRSVQTKRFRERIEADLKKVPAEAKAGAG